MTTKLLRLVPLLALLALAVPATAPAQATRTWVSGINGSDANPCTRTAPCTTWAGAMSRTAEGGVINALDPGGFGALHITKSLTIDGHGTHASILACGNPHGVLVNTNDATDKVTLRDLRIIGCSNGTQTPGVNGIRHLRAGMLRIEDSRIYGFGTAGIHLEPDHAKSRVIVEDTRVYDNNVYGILARARAGGNLRASLSNVRVDENGNGVVASAINAPTRLRMWDSTATDNGQSGSTGYGVWAGLNSFVRVGDSRITGNVEGLRVSSPASLISYGGNIVDDNATDGAFESTIPRK